MTPSKIEIDAALERILNHKLFSNSVVYERLLRYLVNKYGKEEALKEYTIGVDLFGKDYGEGQKEGTVRSYMYQLRKRMAGYYEDPNTEEVFRFEIKKGQYNLSIVEVEPDEGLEQNEDKSSEQTRLRRFGIGGLFVLALLSLVLVKSFKSENLGYFWSPFFDSDSVSEVVVSDQFIVLATNQYGEARSTIFKGINSMEEFVEYSDKHPDRQLRTTDYTMISKMAPFAVQRLTRWFFEYGRDFSLRLESQLNYDDVSEKHLIFVGQFKSMNFSKHLFLRNSKAFSTYFDGFMYTSSDGSQKEYNTVFGESEDVEYAMVSFDSFAPGKNALYFVSNNDIGVMAIVRNFTDSEWLSTFLEQLPAEPTHFNALFEVRGLQRNDVSCKLVELELVAEQQNS